MGTNVRHFSRIINNIHVDLCSEIPYMRGLYKDHKIGRKYRPLVNGNVGPVSSLSEILSIILRSYMQELCEIVGHENTVKSTEELLNLFETFNKSVSNDYA